MKKLIATTTILFVLVLQALGVTITADETVGTTIYSWDSGKRGIFEASGSWGSGTLTLYRWIGSGNPASGNGEWVAFNGGALTDAGGVEFVTLSAYLSYSLSGSTSPDIDFFISEVKE